VNGFMRITRMDFYHNTVIGQVWEVNPPASDKSHLDKYNHTALKAANTAPTLSALTYESGVVKFDAGKDDEFVHHYVLTVSKGSSTIVSKKILADFYRVAQPSQMKSNYSVAVGDLPEGDYTLRLVAYDSWDAASEPLVKNVSVKSSGVDNLEKYLGTYTLSCKIFEDGKSTVQSGTVDVTISASGKTPDNVLISGLYQNAVLPGRIDVDSSTGAVRLGLSFDGNKGQKLSTPVSQSGVSYNFIALLPGLGTQFISGTYNFKPFPITASENAVTWWGSASSDGTVFSFNSAGKQSLVNAGTTYYIIAISCVLSKTEDLSAGNFAPNWNKVYQANPGNNITTGMTFTKK